LKEYRVQCAETLRVQAYFDGEVDAVSAAEIERHAEHCNECRALLQDLEKVRTALRQNVTYAAAPAALRSKIMDALGQEGSEQISSEHEGKEQAGGEANTNVAAFPRPKPKQARQPRVWRAGSFWTGAFSGLGGAAIAAALAFFVISPSLMSPLSNELVSAHVRSLMPNHLIDVVSTDKHTVKPWFAGHADVSPAVADFDSQGYKLIGGRADYIEHQRSAVVVYQHGAHFINVFTWAAAGARLPSDTTRSGYHLAFWQQGDIQYCAVSDTGWDELLGLVRLLREQT
jgi:anti-sigma factor (TIGR02949 family)